jgi:hypothetical protein
MTNCLSDDQAGDVLDLVAPMVSFSARYLPVISMFTGYLWEALLFPPAPRRLNAFELLDFDHVGRRSIGHEILESSHPLI